jgi:hypothetical protein
MKITALWKSKGSKFLTSAVFLLVPINQRKKKNIDLP